MQRLLAIALLLAAVGLDPAGRITGAGGPAIRGSGPVDAAPRPYAREVADVDDAVSDSPSTGDDGSHPIVAPHAVRCMPIAECARALSAANVRSPHQVVPGGARGRSPPLFV